MTYRSPAFDINGNLVTIDLEGGSYANLPEGYYTTPGQAAVARRAEQNTGTPATAQQVAEIYADTSRENQDAIQEIFDAPPAESAYVAPTPPATQGWQPPPVTPPPTPAQLVAQMYVDQGYTPPPAAVLDQIVSGAIVAPLTEPLADLEIVPLASPPAMAAIPAALDPSVEPPALTDQVDHIAAPIGDLLVPAAFFFLLASVI